MDIVQLAALLHDVGDAKYARHNDLANPVSHFLLSQGAPADQAAAVQNIANKVSYSKECKDPTAVRDALVNLPELGVVQDADRLDALGAIGVGRCFTFGASTAGRTKVSPEAADGEGHQSTPPNPYTMDTAIEHFHQKLFRLESLMKTETGKRMAKMRSERLTLFENWWREEQSGVF
ncbi:MAG: hypothetical protein Q9162_006284 [Coniocarpon cinnabarinum]